VKRALTGLLLVLVASTAHLGLIFVGIYRRHPVEWWVVAAVGALLAATAFRKPGGAAKAVAVVAIVAAAVFGYVTTVGTRIERPPLPVAASVGQVLPAFTLIADDGRTLVYPSAASSRRATLLVLFRGVW
jgi:hypothetical protein